MRARRTLVLPLAACLGSVATAACGSGSNPQSYSALLSYLQGQGYGPDVALINSYTLTQNQALKAIGASYSGMLVNGNGTGYAASWGQCIVVGGNTVNEPCSAVVGSGSYLLGTFAVSGLSPDSLSAGSWTDQEAKLPQNASGTASFYALQSPTQFTPVVSSTGAAHSGTTGYTYYQVPFVLASHGKQYDSSGTALYEVLTYFRGIRYLAVDASGLASLTCLMPARFPTPTGPSLTLPLIEMGLGTSPASPDGAEWSGRVLAVYDSAYSSHAGQTADEYQAVFQYTTDPACSTLP